jgi:hypothetical protein
LQEADADFERNAVTDLNAGGGLRAQSPAHMTLNYLGLGAAGFAIALGASLMQKLKVCCHFMVLLPESLTPSQFSDVGLTEHHAHPIVGRSVSAERSRDLPLQRLRFAKTMLRESFRRLLRSRYRPLERRIDLYRGGRCWTRSGGGLFLERHLQRKDSQI